MISAYLRYIYFEPHIHAQTNHFNDDSFLRNVAQKINKIKGLAEITVFLEN